MYIVTNTTIVVFVTIYICTINLFLLFDNTTGMTHLKMCSLVYHIVYKRKWQQKYCTYVPKMLRAGCGFIHRKCHTENSLRFAGRRDLFICLVALEIKHR